MYYARTSHNEIETGEAEKYGAIAVRWTQDAQVIIITRIKLFEVEKKYIYSISYHTAKKSHLIFFFRYAAKLPVHPLSECVCVYVLAEKLLVKCS